MSHMNGIDAYTRLRALARGQQVILKKKVFVFLFKPLPGGISVLKQYNT